ncbi:MFS transporter [Nocardia australiensis]|uniref:MFS transporter n=1 Tax=Nocardia australiensis TaxID=2887191 RepID=UPI001D1441B3|nr:MFS transporter [Nocardia australiensis]
MSNSGLHANRNFLLLWSGNATSLVGFHGVRIAYPLLVLAVTGSPAAAGWIGFALSLPGLIFQLPAGVVADGPHRVRTLIRCQYLGLAATGVVAIAVAAQLPSLWLILMAAAFIEGSVFVFGGLCELGVIRDVVAPEHRPAAFSFLEAEQPIAILIGRATGAAIYGAARWLPFVANAVSYLYCLVTLLLIRSNVVDAQASTQATGRRDVSDGVRVVWAEPFLRMSTMISGLSNIVIQVVLLLILVELDGSGYPTWTVGAVLGAAGVGGLFGAAAASWLTARVSPRLVYRGALWAWTALLAPIALSDNPFVLAACWCGVGGVGVVTNVAMTIYRVEVIPEQTLLRAIATMTLVCDGAVALGALGAGYLLATVGTVPTRWIVLGAMCALAVYASTRAATAVEDDLADAPS